jgi:hypothetical protein
MSKTLVLFAALGLFWCATSAGCCHFGNGPKRNCPTGSCAKHGHSRAEHAAAKDEYDATTASHEEAAPARKSKAACSDGSCQH